MSKNYGTVLHGGHGEPLRCCRAGVSPAGLSVTHRLILPERCRQHAKQILRRQHVCRPAPLGRKFMAGEPDQMEHGTLSIIQQWLRKKAAADAAHHFLFALFLLSVGTVLLAVTVCFACAVLWVALNGAGSALSEILW